MSNTCRWHGGTYGPDQDCKVCVEHEDVVNPIIEDYEFWKNRCRDMDILSMKSSSQQLSEIQILQGEIYKLKQRLKDQGREL